MKKAWGIFWIIAGLLGINALWEIVQFSSESRNAVFLGMSAYKLAMCGGVFLLILFCITGAYYSFSKTDNLFSEGKAAGISAYVIIYLLILCRVFLAPPIGKTALERSLLERLIPLIYWGIAFSAVALILSLIQKFKHIRAYHFSSAAALIWGCVFFLFASGMILLALKSGTGLDPISGTFYRQGVSLLEGHIFLPLLLAYPLLPLYFLIRRKASGRSLAVFFTILSALGLWTAAALIWISVPFEGRSYFAPALRLPNNNFYPASDAENYDLLAQSILIGNGFRNGLTIVRPLYAAFLALLHVLFGNDYIMVTNGQIIVLALIPMLAFLIAKRLKCPSAGVLAAIWIIYREIYSIRLSPLVQVSNSRLMMSDLPTMLLVLCVILFAIKWYRQGQSALNALLCGGFIGLAMLIRTQCFVLIPAVCFMFFISNKKAGSIWKSVFISLLGCALVFAPWYIWMDKHPNTSSIPDVSESGYLLTLYKNAAGETDPEAGIPDIIMNHPGEIVRAVGSHFLNNEISSLLVLPVRNFNDLDSDHLFFEDDLFWYRENARGTLESNRIVILIFLVIVSFGIIHAVRETGTAGLIPLVIHIVYNLGNAFALTSGFRFILPVDWVLVFYFAFGSAAVLRFLIRLFLFDPDEYEKTAPQQHRMPSYFRAFSFAFAFIFLLAAGMILPVCDSFIPARFGTKSHDELLAEWKDISENDENILSKYSEDDLVILEGRAFYPRFYKAGEGDSGGNSRAKRGLDEDRVVWMFHNDRVHVLNCPVNDEQIRELTHPTDDPIDVLIVGSDREDFIDILEMIRIAPFGD